MGARPHDVDPAAFVAVPAMPGPLRPLAEAVGRRDDVDGLLDEVVGEPDDRGATIVEGVLIVAGGGAVTLAQVASLPSVVTIGGVLAVALGAILPLRSLWRKAASSRRSARLDAIVGDGLVLRIDAEPTASLAAAYDALRTQSSVLVEDAGRRVREVGHDAMWEVAGLLHGRLPTTDAEREYIDVRARALGDLAQVLLDPRVGDGDGERRQALVQARVEVDRIAGGSSVERAADLALELLGGSAS
jgi:hypothetical protein